MVYLKYRINKLEKEKLSPQCNNISKFTNEDEYKLVRAIEVFNNEIRWEDMWTLDIALTRLASGWILNVLRLENQIQGWTWLDTDLYYIRNVYVTKPYRNKGWGNNLVKATTLEAQRRGIVQIYSEVDEWNLPSLTMFKNLGWSNVH